MAATEERRVEIRGQETVVLENYLILETVCMCNFGKYQTF